MLYCIFFQALELLSSPLHANSGGNMRTVFKYLMSSILSTNKSCYAPSSASTNQERQLVQDNAVKFVW